MESNLQKLKSDLSCLRKEGWDLFADLCSLQQGKEGAEGQTKAGNKFFSKYQPWYSEAQAVIKQILPERAAEFCQIYEAGKRKDVNMLTYTIQDWMMGVRAADNLSTGKKAFDDCGIVTMRFQTQVSLLDAAAKRFDSALFDIKEIVQADLFDSELDAASELLRKGFVRASGALTGVVLEKHLRQVCDHHDVKLKKARPTLNDYDQALYSANVYDVITMRFIQRLSDLRNLCDHDKKREPTVDEMSELIIGVQKTTKTIF